MCEGATFCDMEVDGLCVSLTGLGKGPATCSNEPPWPKERSASTAHCRVSKAMPCATPQRARTPRTRIWESGVLLFPVYPVYGSKDGGVRVFGIWDLLLKKQALEAVEVIVGKSTDHLSHAWGILDGLGGKFPCRGFGLGLWIRLKVLG